MIEYFFSQLTEKAIRRGIFHSVPDLISAIEQYLAAHNTIPSHSPGPPPPTSSSRSPPRPNPPHHNHQLNMRQTTSSALERQPGHDLLIDGPGSADVAIRARWTTQTILVGVDERLDRAGHAPRTAATAASRGSSAMIHAWSSDPLSASVSVTSDMISAMSSVGEVLGTEIGTLLLFGAHPSLGVHSNA